MRSQRVSADDGARQGITEKADGGPSRILMYVEVIVFDHRDRSESGNILILILVILAIIALIIWIVQQLSN